MSMVSEFREFIARGNVVDLAVGVIIGAAFSDIVKSLVDHVIMPPIGMLLSGIDFAELKLVLKADDPATPAADGVAIEYGLFINACITFLIVALAIFMLVKAVNSMRRKAAEAPPAAPTPQEVLLMEIRDELKARPR